MNVFWYFLFRTCESTLQNLILVLYCIVDSELEEKHLLLIAS